MNEQNGSEICGMIKTQKLNRNARERENNTQKEASKRSKRMNITSRNVDGKTVGAFLITASKIRALAYQIEQFTDLRIGWQSIQ